jgi:hypothetical protein
MDGSSGRSQKRQKILRKSWREYMSTNPKGQSDKTKIQQAHTLISKYQRLYRLYGKKQTTFNRYSAKYGMIDVIDSIGVDRASELLDYYFTTNNDHSIEFFYKNFDKIDNNEKLTRRERARRAKIRRETEQRVREGRD